MWRQMGAELRESYADMVQKQGEKTPLRQKQLRWDQEHRDAAQSATEKDQGDGSTSFSSASSSSSAYSATFSPASTSPFATTTASPSWGSFFYDSTGTDTASSPWTWPFHNESSSASARGSSPSSATTPTPPASPSPFSWAWPRVPSFIASLFGGRRRDDRSGGWGWGAQETDGDTGAVRPAASAAALAARAEAAVAAAAASAVDAAAPRDPRISTTWAGDENRSGAQGSRGGGGGGGGGGDGATPAREWEIAGSEMDAEAFGWWTEDVEDEFAGEAVGGPAAGAEGRLEQDDLWESHLAAEGEEEEEEWPRGLEGELEFGQRD